MTRRRTDSAVLLAMLCAAMVLAHQVAAKATRQALFLSEFNVDRLLVMIMGAADMVRQGDRWYCSCCVPAKAGADSTPPAAPAR